MDLHVYRNSQDRWHHLKSTARERGAVLAWNAVTLDELVQRLTPDANTATPGQRLAAILEAWSAHTTHVGAGFSPRYAYDAISELKGARVRPSELRAASATFLADLLDGYNAALQKARVYEPQDRRSLAASRVREGGVAWLERFRQVVLHGLYDLTDAEFLLIQCLIETLPGGGTVILFNATANVKPTQFAEWTWQRFIRDESLAEKTFPEFCRPSHPTRAILERLFVFDARDPLPADDSLRIIEASGRYKEVETIGADVADLLGSGANPNEIAVVVRHIETYGEMLEDVFARYGIPHSFETGVPLLRVPFIKYWLSLLDLITSDRSREALARVMSSAYFTPRLSPAIDVERALGKLGYIDRHHLCASALAARKHSPLTAELERFEQFLDKLERAADTVIGFLAQLQPTAPLTERDQQAWRALADEIESASAVFGTTEALPFAQFRRFTSEAAAIRTVDRRSAAATAPGLGRVRIIAPHSLGYRDYKWIFAPGFTDSEIPARTSSNPLLPDTLIDEINARIRPRRLMTSLDRSRREPLYLFVMLDSATRRVTLTYPGTSLEGEPMYPSVYVGEIARHYTESPVSRASVRPAPRGDGEWRSRVAEEWHAGRLRETSARTLLGDSVVDRAKLESQGTARAHIGRTALSIDGVWHPSELNSLSSCPFIFLARHRLKLRAAETPDFEVPALEIGIFAHGILREFYSQPVPSSIDEAGARMQEIIARQLAAADVNGQGPYSVFDPALWKIRRRQLVSVLDRYVRFAVADARDGFVTKPDYLDEPLPTAAMGETLLAGKPDHVAVHRSGVQIDAIRIDDFKYSAASSSTAKQLKQSFQIPVYAYLATRALGAEPGVRIEGRYLLLRSPGNPVISQTIDEAVFDEVRSRIDELTKKVCDGRLAPDPADKQACAECQYRRLCRMYGG
jgi:RecB family exonuclease